MQHLRTVKAHWRLEDDVGVDDDYKGWANDDDDDDDGGGWANDLVWRKLCQGFLQRYWRTSSKSAWLAHHWSVINIQKFKTDKKQTKKQTNQTNKQTNKQMLTLLFKVWLNTLITDLIKIKVENMQRNNSNVGAHPRRQASLFSFLRMVAVNLIGKINSFLMKAWKWLQISFLRTCSSSCSGSKATVFLKNRKYID